MQDEELIESYLEGREKSLEELISRYLRVIYNFVYKYAGSGAIAEDITQEVFIKVWKNIKKFDAEASFRTWLFSIAKNTAIDWARKKKPILFSEFDREGGNILEDLLIDDLPLPDEIAQSKYAFEEVSNAYGKISADEARIIKSHDGYGLTFIEIAKTLGRPLHTVKSIHRRALIKLRKILGE